jgi:outer membrane protein OmpA-like peptidoglycan-associated protein
MNRSAIDKPRSLSHPLILLLVLAGGLGVFWHLTQNVIPRQANGGTSVPVSGGGRPIPVQSQKTTPPPVGNPAGQPAGAATPDGSAGTKAAAPAAAPANLKNHQGSPAPSETPKDDGGLRPTPEAKSANQTASMAGLPKILTGSEGRQISTGPILFNSGGTTIRESSLAHLRGVAELLKSDRGLRISIIGHTDNLGSEKVNLKVSAERAAAVRDYLVSQGVESPRLVSSGIGSGRPIASNDTQLGRQANRRIEFLVISPK